MSRYSSHNDLYSKVPLSVGDNRDENILIDVLGNWIPECDLIYYGLLNSHYSEELYKLKNSAIFKPYDIYHDTCYFTGDDLIRYLASPDNSLADLSEEYLSKATETALEKYMYVPCNETMFRHSIIELAYFDFVKSITLVYPWDMREIDYQYLRAIIPYSVLGKFKIVSGDIDEYIKTKVDSEFRFTTIVLNSIATLNDLIDNSKEYRTESSFFLLRNHSENVSSELVDDNGATKIKFTEIGTEEILNKLIDDKKLVPKTQMRFARYEPILFDDAKPDPQEFVMGR